MLKMPFQKASLMHSESFSTVVTKDLLLGVLAGDLADALAVSRWLKARGTD